MYLPPVHKHGGCMNIEVGQTISIDGENGFTVVKIMKMTVKAEKDGVTKVYPIAMIDDASRGAGAVEDNETTTDCGEVASMDGVSVQQQELPLQNVPTKRRKKPETIATENPNEETAEDAGQESPLTSNDVDGVAVVKKPRKPAVNDSVTVALAGADTASKVEKAARTHSSFPFINKVAFKRAIAEKGNLQLGLLRMRVGNMLRAAVRAEIKNTELGKVSGGDVN